MINRDPTNGELYIMLEGLEKTLGEIHKDVLATKAQAQATNGRVTKLEFWRNAMIWFASFLVALGAVLTPILWKHVKSEIRFAVNTVFEQYGVEVRD